MNRHATPSKSWRALALGLLLVAASAPAAAEEDLEPFVDEMDTHLAEMEASLETDTTAPLPEMQAPATPGEGSAAEAARLVRDQFNAVIGVRNAYLQALAQAGTETLFDANRIAGDAGLADSRRILERSRAAADIAHGETLRLLREFPDRIHESALRPDERRGMITGVIEAMPQARARIEEQYALEFEAYDVMSAMFDHLAASTWEVQDGQVLFATDADVEQFNASLARIQEIVAKQTALQSDQIDRARDSLQQVRD